MSNGKIYSFVTPIWCNTERVFCSIENLLPYYAVPEKISAIAELPLTPNGKIDKRALKEMAAEIESLHSSSDSLNPTIMRSKIQSPGKAHMSTSLRSSLTSEKCFDKDLEASIAIWETTSSKSSVQEYTTKVHPVPEKRNGKWIRGIRFRILIVYRMLFTVVWLTNLAIMVFVLLRGVNDTLLTRVSFINLTVAILVRQDNVVNAIYTIVCSIPRTWPLWIRRRAAKVYHFGGIHTGAATAAIAWFMASLFYQTWFRIRGGPHLTAHGSVATLVLSYLVLSLLVLITATAWPPFRKARHDLFELIHRFVGWAVLVLIWIQIVLSVRDYRNSVIRSESDNSIPSLFMLLLRSPEVWMLVAITASIASSWLRLRKVNVEPEFLSDHAVRLHFDYDVPVDGSFVRLSNRPLMEWHSFATIDAPVPERGHPKGFSLVVSNAGDWTKDMIQKPRSKIWKRGVPSKSLSHLSTTMPYYPKDHGLLPCQYAIPTEAC
jgi:hypothetical protein